MTDLRTLDIGLRCLAGRRRLQITQADLAQRAGVSISTIVRLERGHSLPPLPMLQRVVGALDLSLSEVLADGPRLDGRPA